MPSVRDLIRQLAPLPVGGASLQVDGQDPDTVPFSPPGGADFEEGGQFKPCVDRMVELKYPRSKGRLIVAILQAGPLVWELLKSVATFNFQRLEKVVWACPRCLSPCAAGTNIVLYREDTPRPAEVADKVGLMDFRRYAAEGTELICCQQGDCYRQAMAPIQDKWEKRSLRTRRSHLTISWIPTPGRRRLRITRRPSSHM